MTTTAIKALERALHEIDGIQNAKWGDPDFEGLRVDIKTALQSLRQQPAIYNDVTLHPKLMREIAKFPTAAAAAKAWGISRQTLHAAVNGAGGKPVPPSILRNIGLERVPNGRRQYREI